MKLKKKKLYSRSYWFYFFYNLINLKKKVFSKQKLDEAIQIFSCRQTLLCLPAKEATLSIVVFANKKRNIMSHYEGMVEPTDDVKRRRVIAKIYLRVYIHIYIRRVIIICVFAHVLHQTSCEHFHD